MNTRANILYFIEHFLDLAQRDGHPDYIRMMQRDIIRVVDAVAPDDGSGAANVKVVRKVSTFPLPGRTKYAQTHLFCLSRRCFTV
jgi:CTD kinase subunit gamma